MQLRQQNDDTSTSLSERSSSSDDGLILEALRKMMRKELDMTVLPSVPQKIEKIVEDSVRRLLQGSWFRKEFELMAIRTYHQLIGPIMEDLVRRVVKDEFLSAKEKFMALETRSPDETDISRERILQLKFFGEVCAPVLTGKAIEGKGDTPISVALVDKMTGQVVKCGPESSAKIEILVLEAIDDDNDKPWTTEVFNKRIIRDDEDKKPHFSKSMYVYLNAGRGDLCNVKLGHDKKWMKNCHCRLGARIVRNFIGVRVEEAVTEPFLVSDSRSKLYGKHYPPSLSDEVWRLDNIGRDGAPCQRLNLNHVKTVQDFRFLLSIDPQRLQEIVGANNKMWKATVDHALTCSIDDDHIHLYQSPLDDFKVEVAFDVVGELKGLIRDSHYVLVDKLSEDDKDKAHKVLRLAFENRKDITTLGDETSLVQQYPCELSDFGAATNCSTEDGSSGSGLATSERIDSCVPDKPVPDQGGSCPLPDPDLGQVPSLPSYELDSVCNTWDANQILSQPDPDQGGSCPLPDPDLGQVPSLPSYELDSVWNTWDANQILYQQDQSGSFPLLFPDIGQVPSSILSELDSVLEMFDANHILSQLYNSNSEILMSKSQNPGSKIPRFAIIVCFWLSRVKMRCVKKRKRLLDLGDANFKKLQRFSEEH